jgi:tetratricopeptide (TPR) repeat protein
MEEISKSFAVRSPSEAETAAVLGTYHLSHGETEEGRKLLEQAVKLEPDLVAANEALGMMHVRVREFAQAAPYIERAVRLNSQSFLTYYYHGNLLLQSRTGDESALSVAQASYARCVQLNPNFAPAHAALAQIYGRREETLDKALQSARTAVTLEPANWSNQLALATVLARRGQFAEAREIADRVAANATEPAEADSAASALTFIADSEQYQADRRRYEESRRQITEAPSSDDIGAIASGRPRAESANETPTVEAPPPPASAAASSAPPAPATPRTYSMIGNIAALDCNAAPQVTLTLSLGGLTMKLHAADLSKVEFLAAGGAAPGRPMACAQLRGITARIQYSLTSGGDYEGEIRAITPTALP